ncbi:MAG: phosphatase PAP2 family protein, partial [Thiothrix sp.]|nr:phosphatase PAP2 family protein [Thiothrix sp.]
RLPLSRFFAVISRLGNGVFWYVLMLVLPLVHGLPAILVSLHMALVGLMGVLIYKWLKTSTGRVRPYGYHNDIFQNVTALDPFSFPSGHTLHAVGFSMVLLHYYPEWALLVIPFTILVALSRVILGLHYPSDVLMGILLGAGLAWISFQPGLEVLPVDFGSSGGANAIPADAPPLHAAPF